ncbi:MAG TPA: glycosyltransferase family 2 protein [Mucilaginibacter sp.]
MTDISVVIPAYNRLWCLPRAVDSCRNTECKTEIIVVDDGSTDGTWDWLISQPDVIAIRQENQGQTYAVNNGVSRATGEYIRFLDSDDFLAEGTIDKQFAKARETGADLVYSKVNNYDQQTEKITDFPEMEPWTDFMEVQLGSGYGSHFLGMLFKTEWVKKIPRRPDFAFREDRMFLLEYGLLEPKIAFAEGCAGYWVIHQGQMQGNYSGWKAQVTNWQHIHIYKKILGELERKEQLTANRKKAASTVLWPLAHWMARDYLNDAVEIVKWIFELDPNFHVPEKGALGMLYKKIGFKRTEQLLRLRRAFTNRS